jgi:hypothetical protein
MLGAIVASARLHRSPEIAERQALLHSRIRLFNGLAALLVPGVLARQVGVDPEANPGITYVFRMFGIRTVLIGADLLVAPRGPRRARALRSAVLIHASDTLAAALAALSGRFPKQGRAIVLISGLNTLLAILANRRG